MLKFWCFTLLMASVLFTQAQRPIDHQQIKEDLDEILRDVAQSYVYLSDKAVDTACLRSYYSSQINKLKTQGEVILFFEYLLDEFYDSHLTLNTNIQASYRLSSPLHIEWKNEKPLISQVWTSRIEPLEVNILGAEVLEMNGISLQKAIDNFPTHCQDKSHPEVREWLTNKIIAGRYNAPRILKLKLKNGVETSFDLDAIKLKPVDDLLTTNQIENKGVIRIENSLGNPALIEAFDQELDNLMETDGLIIDLRNTVGGGDSYIARAIMGRFLTREQPYQKHAYMEDYGNHPPVKRSWMEYVSPRGKTYMGPVVVLVGRWTGSMGEGLAIGMEGIQRGTIAGTEWNAWRGRSVGLALSIRTLATGWG